MELVFIASEDKKLLEKILESMGFNPKLPAIQNSVKKIESGENDEKREKEALRLLPLYGIDANLLRKAFSETENKARLYTFLFNTVKKAVALGIKASGKKYSDSYLFAKRNYAPIINKLLKENA